MSDIFVVRLAALFGFPADVPDAPEPNTLRDEKAELSDDAINMSA
jgi:hypothetical protein